MKRIFTVTALISALLITAMPLEAGVGKNCSLAGTWYGGAEGGTKYLMTISPKGGNRYTVIAQGGYSLGGIGVVANTSYAGEVVKIGPHRYLARMISLLAFDTNVPPAAQEVDAGSGTMELTSCSEMTSTLDFFVAYLDPGATPFVDDYDLDLLQILHGGEPIVEMYERISMAPME